MHFVDTQKCKTDEIEKYLSDKNEKYKKVWKKYVDDKKNGVITKQPTDNQWNKPFIKEALSDCFFNNCGYCGKSTIYDETGEQIRNEGDVDHFIPKSKDEKKVYSWDNYVWSCPICNGRLKVAKLGFLNPTVKNDCDCIDFSFKNFEYCFKKEEKYKNLKNKFKKTINTFSINNINFKQKRKVLLEELEFYIEDIERYQPLKDYGKEKEYNEALSKLERKLQITDFKLLAERIFIPKLKTHH